MLQIGGSLAKLVYFTRDPNGEGGKMNFKSFETENFDDLIFFMARLVGGQRNQLHPDGAGTPDESLYVVATGGGAYKHFDKIQEVLGVEIYREDEMECLIVGW
jgi:pantothenate kinase